MFLVAISPEKIVEIREANPIVEVIGSYIPLKKAGKNYKGLCPFHQERTPSFSVSPDKGVFHCFGCGKSGNVFTFLMEYNNLSFFDAVRTLGERAGIQVELSSDEHSHLYRINEWAAKLYHSLLREPRGKPGRHWIESRGLHADTVNKFMLGYAPESDTLFDAAKNEKFNPKDLEELGLLSGTKDVFHRKIIFPIRDRFGRVVGFGSRVLDNSEPKYINSKETPVFKKGSLLYGIYEAKTFLRGGALLVEGYMDLLSVYQSGTQGVVASLGTSFTSGQARCLKTYTDSVILAYDGDSAGRKAADRAIDILLVEGFDVKVLSLPENEDPDSWVRKHGKLDLSKLQSFIDFKIGLGVGREPLIRGFQELLGKLVDPLKKELLADDIAQRLGINKELLLVRKSFPVVHRVQKKSLGDLEAELLGIAVSSTAVRELLVREKFDVVTPNLKEALALVLKGDNTADVTNSILDERLRECFISASFWDVSDYEKLGLDYLHRIKELRMRDEKKLLKDKIAGGDYSALIKYQHLYKYKRG